MIKPRGKAAATVPIYYVLTDENVTFLIIYDKSEKESIDEAVLDRIIEGME